MNLPDDLSQISNLGELLDNQHKKMEELRNVVKRLEFVPLDPGGSYQPVTFKAFDGGMFSLNFNPFEFDIVIVTDSNGNRRLSFAAPSGDLRGSDELDEIIRPFEQEPVISGFLKLLGRQKLTDITEVLTDRKTLMELGEFACMFDKVEVAPHDEKTIVMRDGLLRTKKLKAELLPRLKQRLADNKRHVKMIGVAKTSKLLYLLQAALVCENVFPQDRIGFVKVPIEVELRAYRWGGHGLLKGHETRPLVYSFGSLYIAKLSRHKNLLVTVEIPNNIDNSEMYSDDDIMEIISYLANNAKLSYPNIGYPQTLMKAHEYAVQQGFPTSIRRDKILDRLRETSDPKLKDYIRDHELLGDNLDKGWLGGRA